MEFLTVSEESLTRAAAVLRGGGLVAFPTETVYGLGADVFNSAALARIFEVKGRPRFDPLIVHIADLVTLEKIADLSLLEKAAREKLVVLAEKLWPGPLTIILPKQECVPGLATSGLPTVAIRFPDHAATRRLIALAGGAVAAPSANPFGYLSPTRAEHVRDQLGEKVDIILDGGAARVGLESTVLDICEEQPRILRPGAAPKEAIEALIGPVSGGPADAAADHIVSPGQLKSHYAPRTPLLVHFRSEAAVLPGPTESAETIGEAFLFFDGPSRDAWLSAYQNIIAQQGRKAPVIRTLSETGNVLEAAARLFETLHELDKIGVSRIYAQLAPEEGLGAAINDRLQRASVL
ncbi:MAG: threonylcarbamoyl-AMP synthase [Treponema sp.]|jgi:L-threonylcarbamoyladenylate synthase|nr:threonylcarbamoyl-AMP synthase [Treponema sp.]